MNTDEPWPDARRGLEAGYWGSRPSCTNGLSTIPDRRFDDLYNLVCDPPFWLKPGAGSRGNRGARSAGVDGQTAHYIEHRAGRGGFLSELRADLKARTVRAAARAGADDPKGGGKLRRLGHPDRAGPGGPSRPQAGARADLRGGLSSRAATASARSAEPRTPSPRSTIFASRSYEWVLEGDITACFDEIDHTRSHGPGARPDRRQACPGPGEGVPQRRHPL